MGIFIERLYFSTQRRMRSNWSWKKCSPGHDLACHFIWRRWPTSNVGDALQTLLISQTRRKTALKAKMTARVSKSRQGWPTSRHNQGKPQGLSRRHGSLRYGWWPCSSQTKRLVTSDSLPTETADSAPFCHIFLNIAHSTSGSNSVPEQLSILLKNHRSVSLPGLWCRRSINPPHRAKEPQDGQGGKLHCHCQPRRSSQWQQLVDHCLQAVVISNPLVPVKRLNTEGKRAGPSENLDSPPDPAD